MADIVITPANVIAQPGASIGAGIAGATITAGQIVNASSTGAIVPSDADVTGISNVTRFYVALNGGAVNQPIKVALSGDISLGAVMTPGTAYYLSPSTDIAAGGDICLFSDLLTGDNVIFLGVAKSTSILAFFPIITGVTI